MGRNKPPPAVKALWPEGFEGKDAAAQGPAAVLCGICGEGMDLETEKEGYLQGEQPAREPSNAWPQTLSLGAATYGGQSPRQARLQLPSSALCHSPAAPRPTRHS